MYFSVKPAIFDLFLTFAITIYLGLVYLIIQVSLLIQYKLLICESHEGSCCGILYYDAVPQVLTSECEEHVSSIFKVRVT